MTNQGIERWQEDKTSRERIRIIATSLTQPRSVNWIKKEANVSSWQTTKDELETLVEYGAIRSINRDGDTMYAPDYHRRYIEEVLHLIEQNAREELQNEIEEIQRQIENWRGEYNIESPNELEQTLTDDIPSEEIRSRTKTIQRWRASNENKNLIRNALALYEDIQRDELTT